jgi:serine/threonine protein kinase/Flp pilus assembly protein TadD
MKMGPSDGSRLSREAAETLAAQLVEEMIQRWRQGERPLPEEFLAWHPELWEHPEAAADLIYEELCLRQEYGPEAPAEQVLCRFPQWRPQLAVLLDCQRVLGPQRAAPRFPAAGESLGDFLLLAELGGGAQGRVFLASQLSLGDRPVVLKVTPCVAHEHLSLARLQHTHIVPLYSVQDHPDRGLRTLCMPYLGGTTLDRLLEALRPQPPARRTGQDLLNAMEELRIADCGLRIERQLTGGIGGLCLSIRNPQSAIRNSLSPSRRFLAGAGYVPAVCWIGACLADALQYAHERGLVHLDLKPSNVLLGADGQSMLLDFHLAREPIHPDGAWPQFLGGTTGYMSPEQQAALLAVQQGRKVPRPVDGRSDIYSLGVVLYEALTGSLPVPVAPPLPRRGKGVRRLHRRNAQVSVGLSDVIRKCLSADPDDRYPDMATLAADLRRHLAHRPLAGVRNRSLAERWRKWRHRRPHGVVLAGMLLAVLTAVAAVGVAAVAHCAQRIGQAHTDLNDGQVQMAKGEWEGAVRTLQSGLSAVQGLPWQRDLADELDRQLRLAEQARSAAERSAAARELHRLADRARFLYGAHDFAPEGLRGLEAGCRALWENRGRIVERLSPAGGAALEPLVRDDLLDLAIFWADLQVRLTPPARQEEARQKALTVLAQAEALFGPSPVLDAERARHSESGRSAARGLRVPRRGPDTASATAWQHYALGRSLLRSGELEQAARELERAVRLQPQGLWPNFYQGLCAYHQGRYADAVTAYSVCIGAAPEAAGCFYNRALAFAALGRTEQAWHDYDQALRLDPCFAVAALNRGMLHYRAQRYADALADLRRARELGADPAVVAFDLAVVNLARGEQAAALEELCRALGHIPHQKDTRSLRDSLPGHDRRHELCPPTSARPHSVNHSAPALGPESR